MENSICGVKKRDIGFFIYCSCIMLATGVVSGVILGAFTSSLNDVAFEVVVGLIMTILAYKPRPLDYFFAGIYLLFSDKGVDIIAKKNGNDSLAPLQCVSFFIGYCVGLYSVIDWSMVLT